MSRPTTTAAKRTRPKPDQVPVWLRTFASMVCECTAGCDVEWMADIRLGAKRPWKLDVRAVGNSDNGGVYAVHLDEVVEMFATVSFMTCTRYDVVIGGTTSIGRHKILITFDLCEPDDESHDEHEPPDVCDACIKQMN